MVSTHWSRLAFARFSIAACTAARLLVLGLLLLVVLHRLGGFFLLGRFDVGLLLFQLRQRLVAVFLRRLGAQSFLPVHLQHRLQQRACLIAHVCLHAPFMACPAESGRVLCFSMVLVAL